MARNKHKSVRHYTIFESSQAIPDAFGTPLSNAEGSASTNETRPWKRSKVAASLSPLAETSTRSSHTGHRLDTLPFDVLSWIGELLLPTISPYENDPVPSLPASESSSWVQTSTDLINFSSTSKSIHHATRRLIHRKFRLRLKPYGSFHEYIRSRLSTLATDEEFGENLSSSSLKIRASQIRHFFIHAEERNDAIFTSGALLSAAVTRMTRLESFAFVLQTENDVIAESPYHRIQLGYDLLKALADHPTLSAVYLCGIKISLKDVNEKVHPSLPEFGAKLKILSVRAAHDSCLNLINFIPNLEICQLWRDFAREPRIATENWFSQQSWSRVKHVDLLGFSGNCGRGLQNGWKTALTKLKENSAEEIGLESVRFWEAYTFETFTTQILPTFSGLTRLTAFSCIIWRDRNFSPNILNLIATNLPNLRELGLGIENSELNWWPGDLSEYSKNLSLLPNLHTFIWNFTLYSELDFEASRKNNFTACVTLASRCPQLRQIRWMSHKSFLVRIDSNARWEWNDAKTRKILGEIESENEFGRTQEISEQAKGKKSVARTRLFHSAGSNSSAALAPELSFTAADDSGYHESVCQEIKQGI